ncbi:MAG: hypothetical protein AAF661_04945 [Pseudomonadota bacterium]
MSRAAENREQALVIVSAVAEFYEIDTDEILRTWSPNGPASDAMRVSAYLMLKRLPMRQVEVARLLNCYRTSIKRMALAVHRDRERYAEDLFEIEHEIEWRARMSVPAVAFG